MDLDGWLKVWDAPETKKNDFSDPQRTVIFETNTILTGLSRNFINATIKIQNCFFVLCSSLHFFHSSLDHFTQNCNNRMSDDPKTAKRMPMPLSSKVPFNNWKRFRIRKTNLTAKNWWQSITAETKFPKDVSIHIVWSTGIKVLTLWSKISPIFFIHWLDHRSREKPFLFNII